MKALILAAGKGSRLGPYTKHIPKPMIEIDNKPILQHNIELCRKSGISNIFINLHYLPDKISNYFGNGSKFDVNITYNYESDLLGTAGALLEFKRDLFNEPFFVLYGDNYSNFDLSELILFNNKKKAEASILYHWRKDVSDSGISLFDKYDRVIKFIEKPKKFKPNGDWVNAGIYYFKNYKIFHLIKKYDDFAKDLFPKLILNDYKIYGCKKSLKLSAIDTPELLKKNMNKKKPQ